MARTRRPSERIWPSPTIGVGVLRLCAAFLVASSLALAPRAEAFVYWADVDQGTIGRANLDGSGVDHSFINTASSPLGVAVDSGHVYWTHLGAIGRANLDGSGVDRSFIAIPSGSFGVAVDPGHVYWTNFASPGSIGRANVDGTGVDQSFITIPSGAWGVAVDAGHVYWADAYSFPPGTIGRANLDGTGVDESFIGGAQGPLGVAVGAGHVFWANGDFPGSIGRANLDGSGVDQSFISGASYPFGVAVDAAHVYWANDSNTIGRANLDGSGVDQSFISGVNFPRGLAVDDRFSPETTITSGPQGLTNDASPSFGFASDQSGFAFQCRLDSGVWDACSSPKSYLDLDDAPHDFEVRAISAVGADPTPASRSFRSAVDAEVAGKASAAKTQKQHGKKIVVKVKVKANEKLTAKASGKVKVNPTYKLKPKTAQVTAGKTKALKLKPKKKGQAKRIAGALERGKKATAKLTVKLTDQVGNSDTEKLSVRLRR